LTDSTIVCYSVRYPYPCHSSQYNAVCRISVAGCC